MRFGKDIAHFASDHARNHLRFGPFAGISSVHRAPVPEDCNSVAKLKYFVKFVRYIDHRNALALQLSQDYKQCFCFSRRQCRSGFVQHQDARLLRKSFADLNKLLLTNTKIADRRTRVQIQMQVLEKLRRAAIELIPLYYSEPSWLTTQ